MNKEVISNKIVELLSTHVYFLWCFSISTNRDYNSRQKIQEIDCPKLAQSSCFYNETQLRNQLETKITTMENFFLSLAHLAYKELEVTAQPCSKTILLKSTQIVKISELIVYQISYINVKIKSFFRYYSCLQDYDVTKATNGNLLLFPLQLYKQRPHLV